MSLICHDLAKRYGPRDVVQGVHLEVQSGQIVGLLGPNGAGKTTTFHMLVGLVAPHRGRITLGGEDITRLPMYLRARRGIGYLSQERSVFRRLSAFDNVRAVLEAMGVPRRERDARATALLDELGIASLSGMRADRLSGGEARRLEITRALAGSPRFLLLDEPFAGIDPKAVEDIQNIVVGLRARGIGLLVTDHNVRETLSITDRSYILSEGRILAEGTPRELAENAEVRRVYLGERFRLD